LGRREDHQSVARQLGVGDLISIGARPKALNLEDGGDTLLFGCHHALLGSIGVALKAVWACPPVFRDNERR
jgi:hypothetical protein